MSTSQAPIQYVSINTSARLHLGFFDLNGELGRKFGSLGLAISEPSTLIKMRKSHVIEATGTQSLRVEHIINQIKSALQMPAHHNAQVNVVEAMSAHAGLGSGTQLALAVGMAFSQLYALNLSATEIAKMTTRGARSGIGIGTFMHGGVVVDGGRGKATNLPPIIARADFPNDWRILLIMDSSHQGVHGEQELAAFRRLAPAPRGVADRLCWHVLMQAMPALAERDFDSFGLAIRALQHATGDYFSTVQGGGRYASASVANVMSWLETQGVVCAGQSSWGPTGFAIFETESAANSLMEQLNKAFSTQKNLSFKLVCAKNQGARIENIE